MDGEKEVFSTAPGLHLVIHIMGIATPSEIDRQDGTQANREVPVSEGRMTCFSFFASHEQLYSPSNFGSAFTKSSAGLHVNDNTRPEV